jgi:predicted transposase YbfD/YdcC
MPVKLDEFTAHFANVEDPRVNVHNQWHSLEDILMLTILAAICGADTWIEVENFGKAKKEWLQTILELRNGIPSHDTLGRVFSLLDPEQFQLGFLSWMNTLVNLDGEYLAIDGKTARRAYEKGGRQGALHMVNAWAVTNHMVFGQLRTAQKSNEITAIPELLNRLNLTGCTVSIDAMGTQTEIAAKIVERGGDYSLSLKANQPTMLEQTEDFFVTAKAHACAGVTIETLTETKGDHGRIETREYGIASLPDYFIDTDRWSGLTAIGYVIRQREINDLITTETAYYLLSYAHDVKRFAQSVRGHWGVENSMHWSLDVSFNEDQSRVRKGYAGENLAVVRHLALNVLKQENSLKCGISAKRKRAGWDNGYLEKLLALLYPAL